ncbi:protein kinase C theta type-like [Bombina bombina]|uniref:protein kinase C theta type-like n=1 Tax=Bombina bombina TaxID=8345 RepID=UPI00235A8A50|nr:protein kinase C theta type-like [Bombina bombina]
MVTTFSELYGTLYDGKKVSDTPEIATLLHRFLTEAKLSKISKEDLDNLNAKITVSEVLAIVKELKRGGLVRVCSEPGMNMAGVIRIPEDAVLVRGLGLLQNLRAGGSSVQPSTSQVKVSISFESLTFHKVIGKGSYGKVMLASSSCCKELLAVKAIRLNSLLEGARKRTQVERRILDIAKNCPFLTHAYAAFQNMDYVFFVMEWLRGGDLLHHIQKNGQLCIQRTRFYAAEIVCGVQFLHSRKIIHRDLKPENILLDGQGHVRIADFGLAADNVDGWIKGPIMGTRGYIAPEMYLRRRYNAAIDWWAVGVIICEMATGKQPFDKKLTLGNFKASVVWDEPFYPEWLGLLEKDLVTKLLCKSPLKRLGTNDDIRLHPFFSPIDWVKLEQQKLEPPFVPQAYHLQKPGACQFHQSLKRTFNAVQLLSKACKRAYHQLSNSAIKEYPPLQNPYALSHRSPSVAFKKKKSCSEFQISNSIRSLR